MAVAPTVERELLHSGLQFQLLHHPAADFSLESARVARVTPSHLAKGVLLRDGAAYVLVVIPADARLDLPQARLQLGRKVSLASEAEVAMLFHDCAYGAVPALGAAYGVETWLDERLSESPDIYFDAGDHELLVRLETGDFLRLSREVTFGRFAHPGSTAAPKRSRPARTRPPSPRASGH